MRRLLLTALLASASLGCVAYPHAQLSVTQGYTQQVAAPVVCGPMGFRKVPLQARWGEYVRLTVNSVVPLRGTALLHANGQTYEPRAFSTDRDGTLVLDARFENLDPDARFALSSDRPIDLTISELEAPAGGSCEGAIFTVEQGALVPSISEAAWLAELERRGGPELAARRAAARAEMEARRQAHYAAWAERQQVQVSAELVAQAEAIRLEHYAAWDARRSGHVEATVEGEVAVVAGATGAGTTEAVDMTVVAGGGEATAVGGASTSVGGGSVASASGETTVIAGASVAGGVASSAGASAHGGAVGVEAALIGSSGAVTSAAEHTSSSATVAGSGACGGAVASGGAWAGGAVAASGGAAAATSCVETTTVVTSGTVTTTASEDVQVSTRVGADVAVTAPGEWVSYEGDAAWSQPTDAQLRANHGAEWEQPYGARLDPVAVSAESKVAVGAAPPLPPPAPVLAPAPSCTGGCGAEVGVAVALPALFHALTQAAVFAAAAPPPPAPRPRTHQAVPVAPPHGR
jgi:hypothetical protein